MERANQIGGGLVSNSERVYSYLEEPTTEKKNSKQTKPKSKQTTTKSKQTGGGRSKKATPLGFRRIDKPKPKKKKKATFVGPKKGKVLKGSAF